jgi:hypothetical protein
MKQPRSAPAFGSGVRLPGAGKSSARLAGACKLDAAECNNDRTPRCGLELNLRILMRRSRNECSPRPPTEEIAASR